MKQGIPIRIRQNGKWNYLTSEGFLLSDRWFDEATVDLDIYGCFNVKEGYKLYKLLKDGSLMEYWKA